MRAIIDYAGNRYEAKPNPDLTAEKVAEELFANLEDYTKMQFELKDGGYLLLCGEAIKRCAIQILDI